MSSTSSTQLPESGEDPTATLPDPTSDSAVRFREVLRAEWDQIRLRRERAGHAHPVEPGEIPRDLAGLALSGGGIRSATFNLGVLQEMDRAGALGTFDYLSTVSGGGYTGGWWSAWLRRDGVREGRLFPDVEDTELDRRRRAEAMGGSSAPDGSLSAGIDPIHHLRLFSNYLTPRKGALSADTWRAVTVIARNLVLTWLVLLPALLGIVTVGQLYFTMQPQAVESFVASAPAQPSDQTQAGATGTARGATAARAARERRHEERLRRIQDRAEIAARPLLLLLAMAVVCTLAWMIISPAQVLGKRVDAKAVTAAVFSFLIGLGGLGVAAVVVLTLLRALTDVQIGGGGGLAVWERWMIAGFGLGLLCIAGALIPELVRYRRRRRGSDDQGPLLPADLARNRIVRVHARVLMSFAVLAVVLGVAGFSQDLIWFLFDPASGGPLPDYVKKAGGWGAVLLTLGTSLYTVLRSSPSGKGEAGEEDPGSTSQLVFAVAPVLLVGLLAILMSGLSRRIIVSLGRIPQMDGSPLPVERITPAVLAGAGFCLLLALYETWRDETSGAWRRAGIIAAAVAGALAASLLPPVSSRVIAMLAAGAGVGVLGRIFARWAERKDTLAARGERARSRWAELAVGRGRFVWPVLAVVAGAAGWLWGGDASLERPFLPYVAGLAMAGLVCVGAFTLAETVLAPRYRVRTLVLAGLTYLGLAVMLSLHLRPSTPSVVYSSAAAGIVAIVAAWVVGLGWMADPNQLSIHAFYKARLVRAYMGASNPNREAEQITESAVGDDVPLKELRNCERGAPYHLLNATLNLVGGRDLSTAQRSADSFTLSRDFCGSLRTGYRPTREYMKGKLSLGTAVAVSGAAASPNMGSKTPSAALAMLMSLFNVRLGFWAPTPDRPLWRSAQARLWPYHLLREFLSQTNDLGEYCYLTDGGHFDNTGLYSLVARGCRYIVVVDCGADPAPCFEDIGTAIRRCRIDFRAEITLSVEPFRPASEEHVKEHFVRGEIVYSPEHMEELTGRRESVRGKIVWIKPAVTPADPADLQQYRLQNTVFPQQTTGDQWFDEAQFESYRMLGVQSAQEVFGGVKVPRRASAEEVFDQIGRKKIKAQRIYRAAEPDPVQP